VKKEEERRGGEEKKFDKVYVVVERPLLRKER
jgi:hypothetical protein